MGSSRMKQQMAKPLQTNQLAFQGKTDQVQSATSLNMWAEEDDMGNKMQAKLASPNVQSDPNLDSTAWNTQKLKDIARQKKQIIQGGGTS